MFAYWPRRGNSVALIGTRHARALSELLIARVRRAWRDAFPPPSMRDRKSNWSAAIPFGYQPTLATEPSVAVVCHIYYAELAQEVFDCLRNIPFPANVFISTDATEKRAIIEQRFASWDKGTVEVRIMPNRGRDIAPKLVGFGDVHNDYDFVLHIHAKRSFSAWRHFLFHTLCGSPEIVHSIFAAFERHRDLGMVFPQAWEPIRTNIYWPGEPPHSFAKRMGFILSRKNKHDYPAGSMFWARTAALRPLLDLKLTFDDFADGVLLEYTIEALYLYVCERAGFTWMKIASKSCFSDKRAIIDINSADDLDRFAQERTFRLLASPCGETVTPALPVFSFCKTD